MNWLPVAIVVGLLALVFGGHGQLQPPLDRRKKQLLSGVVKRKGAIFPEWQIDDGIVRESPVGLAATASRKLGRTISPEEFALASMIASEAGGSFKIAKIGVAWAARNKAQGNVLALLAPDGRFAQQEVGPRYASTAKPPTVAEIEIAEKVLAGRVKDPTGGATHWDSPALQLAEIEQGKKRRSPEEVAARRKAAGLTQVTLPGVPAEEIRFWAKAPRPAATLGAHPSRLLTSAGQWWLPTPLTVAQKVFLFSKPAHAAEAMSLERKPILPTKPMPSIVQITNTASERLGRMVDPRAIVLAAVIAAHGGRVPAAHVVVNRAKADGKRIFELAAPDGKLGKKGDAGRVFASDGVPTLEEVQLAERILVGNIPDPTGRRTVMAGILPPSSGLVGHDEVDVDAALRGLEETRLPTGPTPKLAQALAQKWGGVWGVPPSFIMTIAEVESTLTPTKVNLEPRAAKLGGAWGLMQITYRTAEDLIRWVKRTGEKNAMALIKQKWRGRAEDLLDPELNVMLGSFYIARLFREFRHIELVAAAYHAGPAAVRSMMRIWGRLALGPYGKIYVVKAQSVYPKHGGV